MLALVQFLALVSVSVFGSAIAYRRYKIAQREQGLGLIAKAAELLAKGDEHSRRAGLLLLTEAVRIKPSASAATNMLTHYILTSPDRLELDWLCGALEGTDLTATIEGQLTRLSAIEKRED